MQSGAAMVLSEPARALALPWGKRQVVFLPTVAVQELNPLRLLKKGVGDTGLVAARAPWLLSEQDARGERGLLPCTIALAFAQRLPRSWWLQRTLWSRIFFPGQGGKAFLGRQWLRALTLCCPFN